MVFPIACAAILLYYGNMIALNIIDIRKFMSAFLIGSLFDDYSLIEAQITTFCTFSIDGRLEKEFGKEAGPFPEEDAGEAVSGPVEYVRWEQVRERCFSVIRGKNTPLFFKFVFFYPKEKLGAFLQRSGVPLKEEQLAGLCLNLRFDSSGLILTTGTSLKFFTPDRSADHAWDEYVRQLLAGLDILVSEI